MAVPVEELELFILAEMLRGDDRYPSPLAFA